jgi:hypothetical protein
MCGTIYQLTRPNPPEPLTTCRALTQLAKNTFPSYLDSTSERPAAVKGARVWRGGANPLRRGQL